VTHDGGSFRVGAGSFFLTGPDVHHSQRPSGAGGLVEYSLNCEIESVPQGSPESVGTEMAWLLSVLRSAPCIPLDDEHGASRSSRRPSAKRTGVCPASPSR